MAKTKNTNIFETPNSKSFQFNGHADGSVGQDVNQFQGGVSFSTPLISFAGRSGLNVEITAVYNSNIAGVVKESNRDSATGILGLGWSLLIDRIEADYGAAGHRDSATFYLTRHGTRNRLYRSDRIWQRSSLDSSFSTTLNQGALSQDLVDALLAQSLVVDVQADVDVVTENQKWIITDSTHEVILNIDVDPNNPNNLLVTDGGAGYEMESFDFSRIRYYAAFQRWEVITSDGMAYVFGGGFAVDDTGNWTSRGESIEWGIKWNNWAGSSRVATSRGGENLQSQYPLSWYISSERAVNRDEIKYTYQQVQQKVGGGDLVYTKAIYPSTIVDVFNRTASFVYFEKEYNSAVSEPREYLDPYKEMPDNLPDAYQSKYEMLYLQRITFKTENDELLATTDLHYDVRLFTNTPGNAPPTYAGDRYKRVLTAIHKTDDQGKGLPPITFTYKNINEVNPGAIASKILPEGAAVLYSYQQTSLAACRRSLKIIPDIPSGAPKIWFGHDYAVVMWMDTNSFSLTVYTWSGRWIPWKPSTQVFRYSGNPDDIITELRDDHFEISIGSANKQSSMVLYYHKDNRILGGWLESSSAPLLLPTVDRNLASGDRFFAVADNYNNTVDQYTWNSQDREWDTSSYPIPSDKKDPTAWYLSISAAANLLMVFFYDRLSAPGSKRSVLVLNYLDESGVWQTGSQRPTPEISVLGNQMSDLKHNLKWSTSGWVFAAMAVTQESNANLRYQISLFTWGNSSQPSYDLNDPFQLNCSMDKSVQGTTPYSPAASIHDSGLITSGPYLLRFNGETWLTNDNLRLQLPVTDSTAFWFAEGQDLVVKTENSENQVICMVQVFDPNAETNAWTEKPISLYNNPPGSSRLTSYYPTAGIDYISFDDKLYYRGTSSNWRKPVQNPIPALPPGSNTTTLINEAPEFMVYLQEQNGKPVQTNMLLLDTGFIGKTESVFESFYRAIDSDGHSDQHSIGKSPAGAGSFVTFLPLNASFDDAQSLTLYRYLNDSITNPITDFPVHSVTVDDGFTQKTYRYSFDADTAAVNPQGYSYKYYNSSVRVGDGSLNGSTKFKFFNGIGQAKPGNPVQDTVLDGQLLSKTLLDDGGVQVAKQANSWQVVDQIQDFQTGEQIRLNGVFVQLVKTENTINGVTNTQTYTYDPAAGQLVSTETTYHNGLGQLETRVNTVVLGYPTYSVLAFLNMLEEQIGSHSTVAVEDGDPVLSAESSVQYKLFDGIAVGDAGTLQLLNPWKEYSRKLPGTGTVEEAPDEWALQNVVKACNEYGYPTEAVDAGGLVTSTLYAARQSPVVAIFSGASVSGQEAYYYGFETYETSGRWQLDEQATPIVSSISNTGTRCLSLPPGVQGSPLTLTPRERSQTFVFGFWAKLDPAASSPAPATAWRITFEGQGNSNLPDPITIDVNSTEWEYYCVSIDLSANDDPVTITITPVNTGSDTIFVDNVSFSMLMGGSNVKVYEPRTFLLTEEAGPHNELTRNVYDQTHRKIGTTSEFRAVNNVIAPYLSRQDHDEFNPAAPNSQLVFQPMGENFYERFRNNGVWTNRFSSPDPSDWQSGDGKMVYSGAGGGELTVSSAAYEANYACRCYLESDADTPGKTGLKLGSNIAVYWDPADNAWHLNDTLNSINLTSESTATLPDGVWTVAFTTDAILFAVEGVVIFDYIPETMPTGALTITADSPLSLSRFIIGAEPQVAIKYFDGSSKSLQGQSIEGANAVVTDTVYDAMARPVIHVKPVEYAGTKGTTGSLVAFRTDVVTDLDWSTGVMSGKAATDYPDDEGYPYVRKQFETSPLGRVVQEGAPGKLFAITGPDPSTLHTTRYRYETNTNPVINSALGLPESSYHCISTQDQDGRVSIAISDVIGRPVATATLLDEDDQDWLFNLQHDEFSSDGSQQTVRLPNFYAPPAGSDASAWVNVTQRNLLGSVRTVTTPDSGAMKTISNDVGQTRFTQNALADQLGLIMYAKYDHFGRTVEAGLVPGSWDVDELLQRANTPEWPTESDGAKVIRRYVFGSDASDVNNIGRRVRTDNYDEASGQLVTSNLYDHDDQGKIKSTTLHIEESGDQYTTRYTYDNLGNSLGTVYASGFTVRNERDSVGRVSRVVDGDGNVLASYGYQPDDQVKDETILPGAANELNVGYTYNSPGWLKQISSDFMTEILTYTSGSYSGKPYYSALLGSVETRFQNLPGSDPNFADTLKFAFDYDARGQLRIAQALAGGTAKPAWSFGLKTPATFDPNGNFKTLSDGDTDEDYTYTPNTNQVKNTTGGSEEDFVSNAIGAITKSVPRDIDSIDYKLLSKQPGEIATGSQGNLSFQYDSSSNRIQKNTSSGTRIYVRGLNGWPLTEINQPAGNGTPSTTEYIYGAQGIFAIRVDGTLYPLLTDHLKSVRAMIDTDNKVKIAFHYGSFGQVVCQYGQADELRYRFTGYEYDPETGLYCAAARLYDPQLKRFYSVDPKMQFYSPYIYGGNNPISVIDPTGEASWWAELVGAVVGIAVGVIGLAATVATGGALGPEATAGEIAAVTAVQAAITGVAGAASTVAGDATTAGLSGEKFTAKRALIDVAAGAAGGVAGTVAGGPAATVAMRGALKVSEDLSVRAVSTIGTITAGVVGGTAGAVAQTGTAAAMSGQSFFTAGNALNIAIGGAAGFGGSLLASSAHMGWGGKTMPVALGRDDFDLIGNNSWHTQQGDKHITSFNMARLKWANDPRMLKLHSADLGTHDVINMHGSAGRVYVTINKPNMIYERPMSPKLFAQYIGERAHPGFLAQNGSIKLDICYAANRSLFHKSVGQTLATALGRDVHASKGVTYSPTGAPEKDWVKFP